MQSLLTLTVEAPQTRQLTQLHFRTLSVLREGIQSVSDFLDPILALSYENV
jgi:hypothetical protein